MSKSTLILSLALSASLIACSKAPEKVAEKVIESAMEKDGTKAKVDLSSSSVKITTTDASGKTSQVEIGAAKVTEADLGVPFYPGTSPAEGGASKVSAPDGDVFTVALHTGDPADKVAAFYREKLKALSAGKQMMDMSGGDGSTNLVLTDDKANGMIQVSVAKADKGTDIQIIANRPVKK